MFVFTGTTLKGFDDFCPMNPPPPLISETNNIRRQKCHKVYNFNLIVIWFLTKGQFVFEEPIFEKCVK